MDIQEKNVLESRILSHLLEFAIHLLHKECQYDSAYQLFYLILNIKKRKHVNSAS